MLVPAGGMPALAQPASDSDNQEDTTTLFHTNLLLVQRAFEYLRPIIPETTVVLPEETLQDLTDISDTGVFTFSETSPSLEEVEVGDTIVGDVSTESPYGFLREVTSITSESGQVILETQSATIEDAIQQGTIRLSQRFTPDDLESVNTKPGVTLMSVAGTTIEDSFFFEIKDVVLYDDDGIMTPQMIRSKPMVVLSYLQISISMLYSRIMH